MTILGKLLVFLVLVLSLVWNALTVNAFVTRTNWKAAYDASQKQVKEAGDAAANMKALLDAERQAADDRVRAATDENARLYTLLQAQAGERNSLAQQFQVGFGAANQANTDAALLQANIDRLLKQVDGLTRLVEEKELQLSQTVLAAEKDRVKATAAELDAKAQKERAERFAATIQELNAQRAGGGAGGAGGAPIGFRGTVQRVDAAGGDTLLTLTPGLDAGLRQGAVLTVSRVSPPQYLGTVRVLTADPKQAVGRFTPATRGQRDQPRPGDELTTSR